MSATDTQLPELLRQCFGYQISQVIAAATSLGIPELLAARPRTVRELGQELGADARTLRLLLQVLQGIELVEERVDGALALTARGALLTQDSPSLVGRLMTMLHEEQYRAWGSLLHMAQSGECAFEHALGAPFWSYLKQRPALQRRFDGWMAETLAPTLVALVARVDFSAFELLVDVGGGSGLLARAVLDSCPELRVKVFDLPEVVAGAAELLAAAPREGRYELVGGDFFDAVPSGGDCYTLARVLHDWPDQQARAILRSCRAAMRPGAKLLLIERVAEEDRRDLDAALHDLGMLVLCGGGERSRDELRELLQASGFELHRIVSLDGALSLIEAGAR